MAMADDKMVDKLTAEMVKKLSEDMDKRMMKEATGTFTGGYASEYDYTYNTVWKPRELEEREYRKRWERDLYQQWDKVQREVSDPVQRIRKEMHEELDEIKTAIRKMGIMLDSDKPSQEQLEKSKMLKEAYMKYKMVEGLVLGKDSSNV